MIVAGKVVRDGELKTVGDGQVFEFSMPEDHSFKKDDSGNRITTWYQIQIWGKQAETASKLLRKGATVQVTGSLTSRVYEGKAYLTVDCNYFQVLSFAPREEGNEETPKAKMANKAKSTIEVPF